MCVQDWINETTKWFKGMINELNQNKLTRRSLHPFVSPSLILPDTLAKGLVPSSQGDDGEKGDDEGEGRVNAPLAEDDAEILSVPGEQHVHATPRWSSHPRMTSVRVGGAHIVAGMVHVGAVVVAGVIHNTIAVLLVG